MRFHRLIISVFLISAAQVAVWAQIDAPVSRPAMPTYLRRFQSDRDVAAPTRLNQFAFRMAGYSTAEDRVVEYHGQWDVDPMKHENEIVIDSSHMVRSLLSQPLRPAVASFGDAIASGINHLSSHGVLMAQPVAVTTDSSKRVIVSDPTARAVHVFDLASNRYFRIQGGERCRLQAPTGVAVDSQHNIYVTDTELGVILVYDRLGRFERYIGERDDREGGIFYQPSGIAIDPAGGHIYVPDTSRHMVVVLDLNGKALKYLGRPDLTSIRLRERDGGAQERGKIQSPTEVVIRDGELYVLGTSRVQIFDLEGTFKTEFSLPETSFSEVGGLAVDVQHHIFVSDALRGTIFVYDRTGRLLYSFGRNGSRHEEFSQPRGLWIDSENRIYVADSKNGRVQVFQLHEFQEQPIDAAARAFQAHPFGNDY